jgi:hypothetical protein
MRLNRAVKQPPIVTHEGGKASRINLVQQLRRSVLSCMLWEKEFYEDGDTISARIRSLIPMISPAVVSALAIEARTKFHLRHIPLFLTAALAQTAAGTSIVSETLNGVIQRADELSEFLTIYAQMNGVAPDKIKPKLSNQVRKGLAAAFGRFDEYQLAKYNRDAVIKLRDVLFLCHAKPKDIAQAALWERLINGKIAVPDTWEVALSGGADKKTTWERLLGANQLGYLALLRNLRNMQEVGVDPNLIREAILARRGGADRVLPFRFTAAARVVPAYEPELDKAMMANIMALPSLPGRTAVLVDVSASMDERLSAKSDLSRLDAAATLASMINAQDRRVFSFSTQVVEVAPRLGMAGVDAIRTSQIHHGTHLFDAVDLINRTVPHDRLIIITDEQATGAVGFGYRLGGTLRSMPAPACDHGYVINVASALNGVGYGPWTHIDGFSEQVLRWIAEYEAAEV